MPVGHVSLIGHCIYCCVHLKLTTALSTSFLAFPRLAAASWPVAELLDRPIANLIGQPAIVDTTDRNPSILNGGLEKISPVYWGTILIAAAAIDLIQINKANFDPSYTPGDLGFDPLGFMPKDEAGKKNMLAKELRNGRLAMIAVTAFAAQEYVASVGIVDQTPF